MTTVAALYVEPEGVYKNVESVDPWDEARDARRYTGPHPVVAHPPCQRWGRFWHGSPRKPHQFNLGEDDGCFKSALEALYSFGGVLEHPADSRAWDYFGITKPPRTGGWVADIHGVEKEIQRIGLRPADATRVRANAMENATEWSCCVYQGHYGHLAGKPTWLLASGMTREQLPELRWGKTEQRIPQWMIDRFGYEKARRYGVVSMVGGKNKTAIRNATPPEFRDLLISIARLVKK